MNYNIRFQNVFVMHKIYVLGLCDHIQLKMVNIMGVCIVAQVLLISSIWHFLHFISHEKISNKKSFLKLHCSKCFEEATFSQILYFYSPL